MNFEIKTATIKDIEDIQQLNQVLCTREHEELDSTIVPDWPCSVAGQRFLKNRLTSKKSLVLLSYVDEKPAGYLIGSISKVERYRLLSPYAELENMYVLRKYRKNGLGTAMFERFLQWCEDREVKRVRSITSVRNPLGLKFYKRCGFVDYFMVMEMEL